VRKYPALAKYFRVRDDGAGGFAAEVAVGEKVTVNYSRVHLVGSTLIGIVIALAPTILIYKVATVKVGAFIFFFPAAILATRLVLWTRERSIKEHADSVRRRYKAGQLPLG
jgi:uncharacterized membrane protein